VHRAQLTLATMQLAPDLDTLQDLVSSYNRTNFGTWIVMGNGRRAGVGSWKVVAEPTNGNEQPTAKRRNFDSLFLGWGSVWQPRFGRQNRLDAS
jgi:hypothetical protein